MHNIGISRTHHFAQFLDREWRDVKIDAKKARQQGETFGGIFLRPYVGSGDSHNRDNVILYDDNFKQLLKTAWDTLDPDALAWWCPTKKVLDVEEDTKQWIVGVVLVIKRVK